MTVGFGSLDMFAWFAEMSAGIFGGNANTPQHFDIETVAPGFFKDPAASNKKVKLFYMSVGTEDPRLPYQKKASGRLSGAQDQRDVCNVSRRARMESLAALAGRCRPQAVPIRRFCPRAGQ
jgi:hypothetical protein